MKLWVDELLAFGWAYGPGGSALRGMRFLPPLVLHDAHKLLRADIDVHAATLTEHLMRYPDWPELDHLEDCVDCVVPVSARPQDPPDVTLRPLDETA